MIRDNNSLVRSFDIKRVTAEGTHRFLDLAAIEEPLDIRIEYWLKGKQQTQNLALTMRTPGADRELAAGLLLAEAVIQSRSDIVEIRHLGPDPSNEIAVQLAPEVDVESWRLARNSFVSSSCGVCGKRSLDSIVSPAQLSSPADSLHLSTALLLKLPGLLEGHQQGFSQTGGLHAAALFTPDGVLELVYEDIGRHNALDKLNGRCLLDDRLPLHNRILFLSSRSSFELVQKAVAAGAEVLVTVGGPSSLAIETARAFSLTLVGFLRSGRFNVYSGDWRIN